VFILAIKREGLRFFVLSASGKVRVGKMKNFVYPKVARGHEAPRGMGSFVAVAGSELRWECRANQTVPVLGPQGD